MHSVISGFGDDLFSGLIVWIERCRTEVSINRLFEMVCVALYPCGTVVDCFFNSFTFMIVAKSASVM
jgi:hypothetical protein